MNWKNLKYYIAYIVPLGAFLGLYFKDWHVWLVVGVAFIVLPILEVLLPSSKENPTPEEEEVLKKNKMFDYILYLHVPLIYALLFYFLYLVYTNAFPNTISLIGMTLSIGVLLGAMGINIAHELGHRQNKFEVFLAQALLLPNLYLHFTIEHNRGHHKYVSTPRDPATARLNESLYAFWLRSILGQYFSAWKLEAERLELEGKKFWSLNNQMIQFLIVELAYLSVIFLLFDSKAIIFALIVSLIGVMLLETVNYIEHYGLTRKEVSEGIYESVKPTHSWNSSHELGRIILFELSRHSDHHYKSTRKYQILRHFEDSPQLPTGYPGSMILAAIPPLWYRIMNKRVKVLKES